MQLLSMVRDNITHNKNVLEQNCTLLSIAGTGSTFLWKHYETFTNTSLPHNHMNTFATKDCAILSIRSPAERLESGYLYEKLFPKYGRARISLFKNVSTFVDALVQKNHIKHKAAQHLFDCINF